MNKHNLYHMRFFEHPAMIEKILYTDSSVYELSRNPALKTLFKCVAAHIAQEEIDRHNVLNF